MKQRFTIALFLIVTLIAIWLQANSCHSISAVNFNLTSSTSPSLNSIIKKQKISPKNLSLLVVKHQYKLYVIHKTKIIKSYPIVLGSNPIDDKLMEGDGCTPEGTYRIVAKYPHKKWSKFMLLDYPNENSNIKHNDAKRKHKIPAKASIGGQVGIHGVRNNMDLFITLGINWTRGCISLKTNDINELYEVLPNNITVMIKK